MTNYNKKKNQIYNLLIKTKLSLSLKQTILKNSAQSTR